MFKVLGLAVALTLSFLIVAPTGAVPVLPSQCVGMSVTYRPNALVIPEGPDNAAVYIGTSGNDFIFVPATVTDAMVLGYGGNDCILFLNSGGAVGLGMAGNDVLIAPSVTGPVDSRMISGDEGSDACYGLADLFNSCENIED